MNKNRETRLIDFFKDVGSFSRRDIFDYFIKTEGGIHEATLAWRIHDLKKAGVLSEIKRGLYSLNPKQHYSPKTDKKIEELASIFQRSFRRVPYCIWDVNWINEFTLHQFTNDICLFETEKDLQDSVWNIFSDNGYQNILWSLRGSHISIKNSIDPIVIMPLITRAPVQEVITGKGVSVKLPTLEKILVDIYEDDQIFHFIQGAEMEKIFSNAIDRYAINYSTLFAYAKRRSKAPALRAFLSTQFPAMKNNF